MPDRPAFPDLPSLGLPVTDVLTNLAEALEKDGAAVLVAPPGAGKTTIIPLFLLQSPLTGAGRILLLEPRRLAARAAARRMAALLGEEPGETVGYAMRMESRQSAKTRILVTTEGVLARMILEDPEMTGVSAVIFDEFHERSLDGDFGLALALDVRAALRSDLRLLVMSATLDGARVAALLGDVPVIESKGRSFPVAIRYEERDREQAIEQSLADTVRRMLAQESGSILAFLPGQGEIARAAERLASVVPETVDIAPLYGAMEGKAQDLAIRPAPPGRRKVVLATAIAETSITIDGVRIVIDSGLSRLPRYEPSSGMTRLETVRASQASADQRAGRAGRTEPGIAIRLWRAEQTKSLPPFTPPEILEADLSGLVLDCAAFGVTDPATLRFLDPPPAPALSEAHTLLRSLGAIEEDGRITAAGTTMRRLALPVRLAHMVAQAEGMGDVAKAAELAVLLSERGLGGNDIDLDARLARFRADRSPRAVAARKLAVSLARTMATGKDAAANASVGRLLLAAWPDRVAMARGGHGRYLLSNGRGAFLEDVDRLAREPFLVVADVTGRAQNARITAAAAVLEEEVRDVLADRLTRRRETAYDSEKQAVRVREAVQLGALTLSERALPAPSGDAANKAVLDVLRDRGLDLLPWNDESRFLRRRLAWLHARVGGLWPDMSDAALLADVADWLLPFLPGEASFRRIGSGVVRDGLISRVPYDLQRQIEHLAPTHYDAPSGSRLPIRYDEDGPVLAVRVQELFGLDRHPAIADGMVPLTIELLSPAHRPIQTTRDLPGFWRGSWADVRSSLRGRYPKHHWPEDPLAAQATNRAKPRSK